MTRSDFIRAVCLALGVGLSAASSALAQPVAAAFDETATAGVSNWRFDAGGRIRLPGDEAFTANIDARWLNTYGGWFTIGGGRTRLRFDYWRHQQRWEYLSPYSLRGRTGAEIYNALLGAVAWQFRRDRRLSPHLHAGAGYSRSRRDDCWKRGDERSCDQ